MAYLIWTEGAQLARFNSKSNEESSIGFDCNVGTRQEDTQENLPSMVCL